MQAPITNEQTLSATSRFTNRLLRWLRLTNRPTVKVYRSFGNDNHLTVHGHVFRRAALPRVKYRDNKLVNLLAVLRLFLVRPYPQALVRVRFGEQTLDVIAEEDGHFRVDLPLRRPLSPGWHRVEADLVSRTITPEKILATGEGQVLVPHQTQFACISDIDDTFLVSHSSTITKRLLVLLTENAHSREPFEGVVSHYQLLAEANSGPGSTNPFFYVSSSEWNLYDYILEFSETNGLPDGVYLLNQLKRLGEVLQTGKNKHSTKIDRISRIIEAYPKLQFILLGDDSQQDPEIYASIVDKFPRNIRCVYIRQVNKANHAQTQSLVDRIENAGVACCYFKHSADARKHSVAIGLVAT